MLKTDLNLSRNDNTNIFSIDALINIDLCLMGEDGLILRHQQWLIYLCTCCNYNAFPHTEAAAGVLQDAGMLKYRP